MRTRTLTLVVRSALTIAIALSLVLAFVISERLATRQAIADVSNRAQSSAILLGASFRRELDKFRLVPVVLADDQEARNALQRGARTSGSAATRAVQMPCEVPVVGDARRSLLLRSCASAM